MAQHQKLFLICVICVICGQIIQFQISLQGQILSHLETIEDVAEFEAPASRVWELLLDWPAIVDWMPDGWIRSLRLEGQGVGAIRHLITGKGVELAERLDGADASSGVLELSLVDPLPWGLLSYRARGSLEDLGAGRCRLKWQGTLEMPERGRDLDSVRRLLQASYAKMFVGIKNVVEA
jgi:hypothetical protein